MLLVATVGPISISAESGPAPTSSTLASRTGVLDTASVTVRAKWRLPTDGLGGMVPRPIS